jgi:hypothetical protein
MEIKRPVVIMARMLGYDPQQLRLALIKRPEGPPEKDAQRGRILVTEVEAREAMAAYLARPTVQEAMAQAQERAFREAVKPKTRLKWLSNR